VHRQRFKKAVAYARAAIAEPKVRAVYEKMAAKKTNVLSTWRSPITSKGMICFQRSDAKLA